MGRKRYGKYKNEINSSCDRIKAKFLNLKTQLGKHDGSEIVEMRPVCDIINMNDVKNDIINDTVLNTNINDTILNTNMNMHTNMYTNTNTNMNKNDNINDNINDILAQTWIDPFDCSSGILCNSNLLECDLVYKASKQTVQDERQTVQDDQDPSSCEIIQSILNVPEFNRRISLRRLMNNKCIKKGDHSETQNNINRNNKAVCNMESNKSKCDIKGSEISKCNISNSNNINITPVINKRPVGRPRKPAIHFEQLKIAKRQSIQIKANKIKANKINTNKIKHKNLLSFSVSDFENILQLKIINFNNLNKIPIKIAEASFSEVFIIDGFIYKIIPFNEYYSKESFYKEVAILNTLRNIKGICKIIDSFILIGKYKDTFITAWDAFSDPENMDPRLYTDSQQYGCIIMDNCGTDLESYSFRSSMEIARFFLDLVLLINKLEIDFRFEHRDLHWGNVLIKNGNLSLIDFSLSRLQIKYHDLLKVFSSGNMSMDDIPINDTYIDNTCINDIPINNIQTHNRCINNIQTHDTCINDIQTHNTCINDIKIHDTCIDNIPINDTCINDIQTYTSINDTCINNTPTHDTHTPRVIYTDLSKEDWLFDGNANLDPQFDVYRKMKRKAKNKWMHFEPKSNIYWIEYILKKLSSKDSEFNEKDKKRNKRNILKIKHALKHFNDIKLLAKWIKASIGKIIK